MIGLLVDKVQQVSPIENAVSIIEPNLLSPSAQDHFKNNHAKMKAVMIAAGMSMLFSSAAAHAHLSRVRTSTDSAFNRNKIRDGIVRNAGSGYVLKQRFFLQPFTLRLFFILRCCRTSGFLALLHPMVVTGVCSKARTSTPARQDRGGPRVQAHTPRYPLQLRPSIFGRLTDFLLLHRTRTFGPTFLA